MKRIAISGYGRIGRLIARYTAGDPDLEVAAINSKADPMVFAYQTRFDSVYGMFGKDVAYNQESGRFGDIRSSGNLIIDGRQIPCFQATTTESLPWEELGIDVVVEATGKVKTREALTKHLYGQEGNYKNRVVLACPPKERTDVDAVIVVGVNHGEYDSRNHYLLSNASCTTNCLAPVVKVLHERFGVVRGHMVTVHAYTRDQNLVDSTHKDDLRRGRGAAQNIVPTKTGAAKSIGMVIPSLEGKLDGYALRVPTPTGSCIDLSVELVEAHSKDEINDAFRRAEKAYPKNTLWASSDPLVSSDIIGMPYGAIVDLEMTKTVGRQASTLAWYDNEAGFTCRLLELIRML